MMQKCCKKMSRLKSIDYPGEGKGATIRVQCEECGAVWDLLNCRPTGVASIPEGGDGVETTDVEMKIGEPTQGVLAICDGCNVRPPWEHRCHERPIMVRGEQYDIECGCPECRGAEDKETNR